MRQRDRRWCEACRDHFDGCHYDEHGNHRSGAEFGPLGTRMMAEQVAEAEREELLHAITALDERIVLLVASRRLWRYIAAGGWMLWLVVLVAALESKP